MQLYHYCSIPTALSILSNRSIRLSSLAHSNDSMEGRWTLLRIQELLTEKRLPKADISPTIEGLEYLLSRFDALGFCLSEKRDLLSQWRSYANDGSGFSIGFSDAFVAYWRNSRTCHQVLYKKKEQDALLRPLVILPFLMGLCSRIHAAIFSFCAGVMPPMPILGRSLL